MIPTRSALRSGTRPLRLAIRTPSTSTSRCAPLRVLSSSFAPPSSSLVVPPRLPVRFHIAAADFVRSISSSAPRSARRDEEDHDEGLENGHADATEAVGASVDKFSSIKDSLTPTTYQALTVAPFKYETMSEVQSAVLNQLESVIRPVKGSRFHPTVTIGEHGLTEEEASRLKQSAEIGPTDLLVKAKTGTGKTLAFLVPLLEARIKSIQNAGKGFFSEAAINMFEKQGYKGSAPDFARMDAKERARFARSVFQIQTAGAVIMSPTRELAAQIAREAEKLAMRNRDIRVHLLVGGESKREQLRKLQDSPKDIIVATPGRIVDIVSDNLAVRSAVSCADTLVLDEADTLLEMGFQTAIMQIQEFMPPKEQRRNLFFSATVSKDIKRVAAQTLERNHKVIDCVPQGETQVHERIPQYGHVVESEEQLPTLMRLIAHDQLLHGKKSKVIVFCNTTKHTQMVAKLLKVQAVAKHLPMLSLDEGETREQRSYGKGKRGGRGQSSAVSKPFETMEIHAQLDQMKRSRTSDRFRNATSASALVTTDVSARGVDYPNVTRVIQLGSAKDRDTYVHRIGRTGRAGKEGRADIILLKGWEDGWPRFEGREFPIKPLDPSAITTELTSMWSEKLTSDSEEFDASQHALTNSDPAVLQELLKTQILDTVASSMMSSDDPDEAGAIRGIFLSLIGFYVQGHHRFRVDKSDVISGLAEYGQKALGLSQSSVHIPSRLAQLLGVAQSGGRRAPSGRGGGGSGYSDSSGGFGSSSRGTFGGGSRGGYGGDRGGGSSRGGYGGYDGNRDDRSGGYGRGDGSRGGFGGDRRGSSRGGFGGNRDSSSRGGFGGDRGGRPQRDPVPW